MQEALLPLLDRYDLDGAGTWTWGGLPPDSRPSPVLFIEHDAVAVSSPEGHRE
jgi:hypothetical protein